MKALLIAALLAANTALAADLPEPPPTDWQKQAELFGRVEPLGRDQDAQVIAWARTHQANLSSGFLFDLSRRLLATDPGQALEWYVVALIRGQYDAGRCLDETARRAVSRLSGLADTVAAYGRSHPREFGAAGLRALARPDLLAHTIAPDWVCAQGVSGMGGRSSGTKPEAAWPKLEERLRRDYTRQFEDMAKR